MKFAYLGVPWDYTSSLGWPGSRYAPDAVREAFKWINMRLQAEAVYWLDREEVIATHGGLVTDRGNVELVADDLGESFRRIERAIAACLAEGFIPMAVGGDDAVTYPIVKGLHDSTQGSWGMVHLDAHLDLMDSSPYQGRFSHSSGVRRATELPRFRSDALVQVGCRNFNFPSSKRYVEERGIKHLSAAEYDRIGTEAAVARVLEQAGRPDHLHLAVDIDVLDPAFAPGAGAFEPGGLTARQLLDFVAAIAPSVDSISIAEVNPLTDFRTMTSSVAANVLAHFAVGKLDPR
ncbi:MAG TPA: arginase family protein [Candidatus Dormibacteraeota bacterium]|nr:arginase family protein [Candidatus Dormibacteraeota bacterium]